MMRKMILVAAMTCLLALPAVAAPTSPAELVEGYFAAMVEFVQNLVTVDESSVPEMNGEDELGLSLEPDG